MRTSIDIREQCKTLGMDIIKMIMNKYNAIELSVDTLVKDVAPEFGKPIFTLCKCKR